MIVYVFNDKNDDRLHTIQTDGALDIYDGMSISINESVYCVSDKPKFHIFKEYNLNVYFVKLIRLNSYDDDVNEHFQTIKNSISDIIRDASIEKIIEE